MKHHDLKIYKEYADAKLAGSKPWEWRYNDRDFRVGDSVAYHVNDCPGHALNGRVFEIVYLVRRRSWCVWTERPAAARRRSGVSALKDFFVRIFGGSGGNGTDKNVCSPLGSVGNGTDRNVCSPLGCVGNGTGGNVCSPLGSVGNGTDKNVCSPLEGRGDR